ncbi:mannuronan 5-epimerase AlgG [Metapseudomonas resinovorans]|uniref:mannuronan 5-epimerase n=1 Tax=Metapseudomonas resinovorans NBRC 106553 TaxID=1245471 RepID=S6ALD3_METRE|nr:mannuronan 5-epimerase AlgG [Pseudomonas resinovorans]BAN49550.1 poly(beta-D-mannuronate) C5-epimerase [Pseudomonas resinovorans NBRC 106553]
MQRTIKVGLALAGWLACTLASADMLADGYRLSAEPGETLDMAPPALPDLSGYTAAAVEAKIQRPPAGRVVVKDMLHEDALDEFIGGDERLKEWVVRQKRMPQAIFIENGYLNTAELARQLPDNLFAETEPGVYLARLPIIVRPGATLHIDRATRELRLSQEAGAFLVNDGRMFITGTRVTAWREKEGTPAFWRDGKEFRPYFLAWGGTETYVVDSVIQSFGYDASKAYGFSISQYSPSMAPKMRRARPTGWLLNSRFIDMWYGFYCYEADDVVIRGNTYEHNIVYGIDPHDRSRRLIIAENEAFGTRKKHGIIISREVNDSWIINNRSHHNQLSGIVLDRSSVNNVVAFNETYKNLSDGITLYESPHNLLWQNRSTNNERHGIRVRNSLDVSLYGNLLAANKLTGIYGHIKDLRGTHRDLEEDPFDPRVSLRIVGDQLVGNGSSPISVHSPTRLELYRLNILAPQKSSGISFSGLLGEHQGEIMDILLRQQRAVLIEPAGSLASKE